MKARTLTKLLSLYKEGVSKLTLITAINDIEKDAVEAGKAIMQLLFDINNYDKERREAK